MTSEERYTAAAQIADVIEAELKRINWWSSEPLDPEAYNFERAFAADTMSFGQWIQFILLSRIRSIVEQKGNFPAKSNVGAYAVRELDGVDEAQHLVELLNQLDDSITTQVD